VRNVDVGPGRVEGGTDRGAGTATVVRGTADGDASAVVAGVSVRGGGAGGAGGAGGGGVSATGALEEAGADDGTVRGASGVGSASTGSGHIRTAPMTTPVTAPAASSHSDRRRRPSAGATDTGCSIRASVVVSPAIGSKR